MARAAGTGPSAHQRFRVESLEQLHHVVEPAVGGDPKSKRSTVWGDAGAQ